MSESDRGSRGIREQSVGVGYFKLRHCCLKKAGVKIFWLLGSTMPVGTACSFRVNASRFQLLIT